MRHVGLGAVLCVGAVIVSLVGCGDDRDALVTDDPPALSGDLPVIDGSTSTRPLRMLIVCGILRTRCEWSEWPDGSRSITPARDASHESFREAVPSSGTHGSYVALVEGRADLILTAREPNQDEIDLAAQAGVELAVTSIALDAFVFLVNDANPVDSLDIDQIRDIYTGSITKWSEVGGTDRPIQPYQRNATSGSQVLMDQLVMNGVPMIDAPNLMLPSMTAPFDAVSRDVDGIGFSVRYFATEMLAADEIRLLRIATVAPEPSSIASQEYPLVTEVHAVRRATAPEGSSARVLVDWLVSAPGQELIERSGYVPLP